MKPSELCKLVRANLGITQGVLAQLVNANYMTISKWETERLVPNDFQISLMKAFLKASPRVNFNVGATVAWSGPIYTLRELLILSKNVSTG